MENPMINGILILAAMAAGTMITRFLPFLLFPGERKMPPFMEYLSRSLPYATMGLLVVYCLKDVAWLSGTHGAPELISIALTAGLHVWRRNTLVSIAAGTVCYMLLVQFVFV